jgi:hypothetical protein
MDSNDPSGRKKPTPLEETAWFQIGFADRPVIELARELRSVAEPLEIPPFPSGPFPFDTAIRGLLRLCPQAWSAAEAGEVSPYGAATIGNELADVADAAARADHQMRRIAELAKQERIVSEHLWSLAVWPAAVALSWIAFRDKTKLCMISSLSEEAFKVKSDDDNSPQSLLLGALKSGKLRATLKGYNVGRTWWSGLSKLDPDASFSREDLVRLWREDPASLRTKHLAPILSPQEMAREPTAPANDEAQPGWRVKDGQVLTKGEKVVLETVRSQRAPHK